MADPALPRWRSALSTAIPFVVVGALWEIVARSGAFPRRLFPPLEDVAETLARLTASGILPHHAFETVARLLGGFGVAAVLGVALGILMGRSRRAEDLLLPLVSVGAPVPPVTPIMLPKALAW